MKTHDLSVSTGTYTNKNGEEKKRWQNVGAVIDKGNGPFIMLEPWFNPAGVAKDGKVLISMFEPKITQAKEKVQQDTFEDDDIPF